ncbi:MAG: PaaI family thioesterase [Paracoccaceae bacterium]|jgi:uncharacterized protein (TIGR00369 family)|nr:PaaI family thioesterase [Paracoccaceae bacterium]MDP7184345.1 PaaI family thioesterase [Paracoccaceae bacterium]
MDIVMDVAELQEFVSREFPQVQHYVVVEDVTKEGCVVRWKVDETNLRPGGSVSGPTMFSVADVAVYLALMSRIGPKALAVTTNCTIDFMRKPAAEADLIGRCTLLKLGKVLVVGDVLIYSDGADKPVARATATYSIPPK